MDSGKIYTTCYYCTIPGHKAMDCCKKVGGLKTGNAKEGKTKGVRSIQTGQPREEN
jgi:hypothetical protein